MKVFTMTAEEMHKVLARHLISQKLPLGCYQYAGTFQTTSDGKVSYFVLVAEGNETEADLTERRAQLFPPRAIVPR